MKTTLRRAMRSIFPSSRKVRNHRQARLSWGWGSHSAPRQRSGQAAHRPPLCRLHGETQYSFSDNASLLGAPGFTLSVRQLKVNAGAGFIVALTGDIMTMPGLPPAAERIDVDDTGKISGLF